MPFKVSHRSQEAAAAVRRKIRGRRHSAGITLMEMLIAMTVVSLVLASVSGIFHSITRQWNGQVSRSVAIQNANLAMNLLVGDLKYATSYNSSNGWFELPADKDPATGEPIRVLSGGKFTYRNGRKVVYYLSNRTGSFSASGNVLWRADRPSGPSFTPNATWSLRPGSSPARGKVEGVSGLSIVQTGSDRVRVTLTVTATEGRKTTSYSVQREIFFTYND